MEIPDDIRAVIDLFEKQLGKVAFPDIDAAALRRQADELSADAAKVAQARAALEAALLASEARLSALRETARRATAYARVYSEAHPEKAALAEAISAIDTPKVPQSPVKKRGRPRKENIELFSVTESAA